MRCPSCNWPAACAATGRARQNAAYCHQAQVKAGVSASIALEEARRLVDSIPAPSGFALLPGAGIIRGEAVPA